MRFYWLREVPNPRFSGDHDYGNKWGLPGLHCPVCNATWATTGDAYPSVDLSHLPAQEQKKYLPRVEENYAEFERLREQVRPLAPPGVHLWPGTLLGPMNGSARGEFGPLVLVHAWTLLMRPEPLERASASWRRCGGWATSRTSPSANCQSAEPWPTFRLWTEEGELRAQCRQCIAVLG